MAKRSFNAARALQGRRRVIHHSLRNNAQETDLPTDDNKPQEPSVTEKPSEGMSITPPK